MNCDTCWVEIRSEGDRAFGTVEKAVRGVDYMDLRFEAHNELNHGMGRMDISEPGHTSGRALLL